MILADQRNEVTCCRILGNPLLVGPVLTMPDGLTKTSWKTPSNFRKGLTGQIVFERMLRRSGGDAQVLFHLESLHELLHLPRLLGLTDRPKGRCFLSSLSVLLDELAEHFEALLSA